MNFKNGDLAIIVGGPWQEAIGRVVKIIWKCRAYHNRGVSADGLQYWMTADGPIYLVRTVGGLPLPAGKHTGEVLYRLKRRPVCGCYMRPLLRSDTEVAEREGIDLPSQVENEPQTA